MVKTARLEKFFVWELHDFDPEVLYNSSGLSSSTLDGLPPLKVQAYDRYNDVKRKAIMKCNLWKCKNTIVANFLVVNQSCSQPIVRTHEYCLLDDDEMTRHSTYVQGKFSKLLFCVDIEVRASIFLLNIPSRRFCVNICKETLSNKFVIKCQSDSIKAYKGALSLCSEVFKAMFSYNFKETEESCMEITDFGPDVVRKMVEFTVFGKIENFDGCEEDVFKIAHKYQMKDLMDYAIYEMVCTTTKENLYERLKLAKIYGLDKFKKWLINF